MPDARRSAKSVASPALLNCRVRGSTARLPVSSIPGVLPHDLLIWLHHPTVTEPEIAPAGYSLIRATNLAAHRDNAWNLEQSALQSGPLRLPHRVSKIADLFIAGAANHSGAGVAGVLAGAKSCAKLVTQEVV